MRKEYFLFVHHTTSILTKLSTWCFKHSGDSSYSLLVNPSHTDEFSEGQNRCLWIYTLWIYSLSTLENTDDNRIFFVRSPHHKHFGKGQHLVLWALRLHWVLMMAKEYNHSIQFASIYLSIYLSICLSVCLSLVSSVCLSLCLPVCLQKIEMKYVYKVFWKLQVVNKLIKEF